MRKCILVFIVICLVGCSQHTSMPITAKIDPVVAHQALTKQYRLWKGTPYRYGGLSRKGVDCSGFVLITFRQRFKVLLPHSTKQLSQLGIRISRSELQSGDLVFFKTGNGWSDRSLHVGIFDINNQFIHASTSHGVLRSSLNNVYWRKVFWQARRL